MHSDWKPDISLVSWDRAYISLSNSRSRQVCASRMMWMSACYSMDITVNVKPNPRLHVNRAASHSLVLTCRSDPGQQVGFVCVGTRRVHV